MNETFLFELAAFLKEINECLPAGVQKPAWLNNFGGPVEDYAQDLERNLRVGLFHGLDRSPITAAEVEAAVPNGSIPTVWEDPR